VFGRCYMLANIPNSTSNIVDKSRYRLPQALMRFKFNGLFTNKGIKNKTFSFEIKNRFRI